MVRTLLLFPLLLLLAACQPAATPDTGESIDVNGEGMVLQAPNEATLRLSLDLRGEDAATLRATAEERVSRLLEALAAMDIAQENINTSDIRSYREFRASREGDVQREIFVVNRSVSVTTRKLEALGRILDAATAAGMNTLSPPEYGVADPREAYRKALEMAAADARANAATLAAALDRQLGRAQRIEESGGGPAMMRLASRAMEADAPHTRIEQGPIEVTASVRVRFELID